MNENCRNLEVVCYVMLMMLLVLQTVENLIRTISLSCLFNAHLESVYKTTTEMGSNFEDVLSSLCIV